MCIVVVAIVVIIVVTLSLRLDNITLIVPSKVSLPLAEFIQLWDAITWNVIVEIVA